MTGVFRISDIFGLLVVEDNRTSRMFHSAASSFHESNTNYGLVWLCLPRATKYYAPRCGPCGYIGPGRQAETREIFVASPGPKETKPGHFMNETIAKSGPKTMTELPFSSPNVAIPRFIRISSAQLAFVPFGRPLRSCFSPSLLPRLLYIFR